MVEFPFEGVVGIVVKVRTKDYLTHLVVIQLHIIEVCTDAFRDLLAVIIERKGIYTLHPAEWKFSFQGLEAVML